MNNEPVAWKALNELNGSYSAFTNEQKNAMLPHISQLYGKWIPLYTHPAKTSTYEEPLHLDMVVTKKGAEIDFTPFFKETMHGTYRIALTKVKAQEK